MKRLAIVAVAFLGCASQQKEDHIPRISVDQDGLADRLAATAPQSQEEAEGEGEGPAVEPPEADAEPSSGPTNKESSEEGIIRSEHPEQPSETTSGDRIAFRSPPPEPARARKKTPGVRVPDSNLKSGRDSREEEFRRREAKRMGM